MISSSPLRSISPVLLSVAVATALVGADRTALAQEAAPDFMAVHHPSLESPQHFAFEVRFSAFTPDIDSDPALQGQAPYAKVFGNSAQVLAGAELDWQAARIPHLGTIGPGLGISYATMSANAQFTTPHNGQTISGETTTLQILPVTAVIVLRADVLWREAHVPFEPYAKLGLGLAFWRASNTLGTSNFEGVSGTGHTLGTELALGLGLNLNVFDQYAARNFDESMGVNNTYLFAEWTRSDLAGLGVQSSALRVGGTYWTFGLSFEF